MGRAATVGLLGLLVAGSGPARARDLDGVVRLFVNRDEQAGLSANAYGGTVDLRWKRDVNRKFSYLLGFRYTADSQELLLTQELGASDNSVIEPRIELRWLTEDIEFSVGQRWEDRRSHPQGGETFERDQNNTFARFRTTFERAPNVLLEYDRRSTSDDPGPDNLNTRLLGKLGYSANWWSVSIGKRLNTRDIDANAERDTDENLVAASLSKSMAGGRVNVFANYTLSDLQAEDRFDRESIVAVPRILSAGFAAVDDTPADGALPMEPALIDGDLSTATPVNIGGSLSGGQTFWNIGAELPLEQTVDQVDLWLAVPIPLESSIAYRFAVWVSDDNLVWSSVTGLANRTYDPVEGRFQLRFTPTSARFLKVVNLSVDETLGSVFISEIEMFAGELRQGVFDTGTRTSQASAVVTWSPLLALTTTLSAHTNYIRNETPETTVEGRDNTVNLIFNVQPHAKVTANVALLNSRRTRSNLFDVVDQAYSGSVTWFPYEDLDLTLVGSRRNREQGEVLVTTDTLLVRAASLLTQGLSGSVEYEWVEEEENFEALPRERRTLRVAFDVRPRQEFNYITSLLSSTIDGIEGRQENLQWRNRISIRPSSVLGLTVEVTRFEFTDDDGWARTFQFDWLPFPGGTLQFSLDYRKNEPLSGADRTVRAIGVRWNVNRQMFLDITGTRLTQNEEEFQVGRTIFNALFQARF